MDDHFILRLLARFRPLYGWLPFVLLAGVLGCLALSVLEVEWVADDQVIIPLMTGGFLVAALLAQRGTRPSVAWSVLTLAGIGLVVVLISDLWPPTTAFQSGREAIFDYWRIRSALFIDRIAGWLSAVGKGSRTTETIAFGLTLAAGSWFIAALLAWSAYRLQRPFLGLTVAGAALAINSFYGLAGIHWAVLFFGLAIPAGTYLTHLYRESEWERSGIDYSSETRSDLLLYTSGITIGIMALVMTIPSINFEALAEAFQRQDAVVAAEETLARAFAGLPQPRESAGTTNAGGLPRSFLLGSAPELLDTVVMTATYRVQPPADLSDYHWRSVSFDIYTGRGWFRSPEREDLIPAGVTIPSPTNLSGTTVTVDQAIDWTYDQRTTRYTLGRPEWFSHDLTAMWRGQEDLVGVRGVNNPSSSYTVRTTLVQPMVTELRAAKLTEIPPEIRARYTTLPDTVTTRVRELAAGIAAQASSDGLSSPYDQARAIESFLHQYPYSLDLPEPPEEVDLVDYFLFDLQTGFCDYYASAMVVMARALGMPARLGVGFLQQPTDEDGVQIIRQRNAHSWAEIYFAGYGWIEFEPTAPFAADPEVSPTAASPVAPGPSTPVPAAVIPIPERAPHRPVPWLALIGLVAAALVAWRLWGKRLAGVFTQSGPPLDEVQDAFAKLQDGAVALGWGPQSWETPAEFSTRLLDVPGINQPEVESWHEAMLRLAELFIQRQYGRQKEPASGAEAQEVWSRLKKPLRRLIWRRRFRNVGLER